MTKYLLTTGTAIVLLFSAHFVQATQALQENLPVIRASVPPGTYTSPQQVKLNVSYEGDGGAVPHLFITLRMAPCPRFTLRCIQVRYLPSQIKVLIEICN